MKNTQRNINNATTWALEVFDSNLSPTQKLICLYLRTHMNDYRDCAWPSVGRIAEKCSLTERAIYDNLPKICDAGYLIKNGTTSRGTVIYAICTPELDSPLNEVHPLNEVQSTPERASPELTKELTNVINREKWDEWLAHLKAKRKTPPATTVSKQQAMLAKYDIPTQAIIIDQSIMNNWQGLFPPKERSNEVSKRKSADQNERGISGAERTRRAREAARIRELEQR